MLPLPLPNFFRQSCTRSFATSKIVQSNGSVAVHRARGAWPSLERSPVTAVAPLEGQTQEAASLDHARSEAKDPEHPMKRGEGFYVGDGGMAAAAAAANAPAVAAAAAAAFWFYSTVVKLLEDELVEAR